MSQRLGSRLLIVQRNLIFARFLVVLSVSVTGVNRVARELQSPRTLKWPGRSETVSIFIFLFIGKGELTCFLGLSLYGQRVRARDLGDEGGRRRVTFISSGESLSIV